MNAHAQKPSVNITAERAILGAVLLSPDALWQVAETLQPQHFSKGIHGQIYGAARELSMEGKRVSLQAIVAKVGEEYDDGLSTVNLLGALRRDAEQAEDPSGWQDFVDVVVDGWRGRRTRELLAYADKELAKPGIHTDDLLTDLKARIESIEQNSQAEPIKWVGDIAKRAISRSGEAQAGGFIPGYDTGLASLDEILGRIHKGDLGVIGAPQGSGKTVLGAQIARRAALMTTTIFFQLEMQDEDMARRFLAGDSGMSVSDIEEGAFDMLAYENLIEAGLRLQGLKLAIDDRPKLRLDQIKARCVAMKRSHGLGMVVIDHLRLIRVAGKFQNKFERIEYVTGELKALAKELQIAVIVLSQVTRASQRRDEPAPQITDFDGGGTIEQDADWIVAMFRRDQWLKTQRPSDPESKDFTDWYERYTRHKGKVELTALKRRRGRPERCASCCSTGAALC